MFPDNYTNREKIKWLMAGIMPSLTPKSSKKQKHLHDSLKVISKLMDEEFNKAGIK